MAKKGEPKTQPKLKPKLKLPDLRDLWRRMPSVPGDSGRFLEEDR